MKVLCLVDTLEVGGAERSLYELCRRFRATEPVICHLYRGGALRGLYEEAGIRVVGLNLPGRYSPLEAMRKTLALVRQERPDVLHGTLVRAGLVARAVSRRTGVPALDSLVNDSYSPLRWQSLGLVGRAKLAGVWAVDRVTAPWAAHFVANSETLKKHASSQLGLDPNRVTVIYRGRDTRSFQSASSTAISGIRRQLGVPDGAPLLLNVARLIQRKGHAELIAAFAAIVDEEPSSRLALAGSGPERAALESLVAKRHLSERVLFLGDRHDVADLLKACDLFLFPSHYEGLPGALIEAMLAAAPVIASDTPVHRECLGGTGITTPIGQPVEIAKAALRLLRSPEARQRLGLEARERALELFSIEAAASKYEDLYVKVSQHRVALDAA